MKKVKKRVAKLLEKYPHLRNDDQALIRYYWRIFEGYEIPIPSKPKTGAASIIRARQKLQEEGCYLPTNPEVIEQRRKQESMMYYFALEGSIDEQYQDLED
jgi:hypothetical protein